MGEAELRLEEFLAGVVRPSEDSRTLCVFFLRLMVESKLIRSLNFGPFRTILVPDLKSTRGRLENKNQITRVICDSAISKRFSWIDKNPGTPHDFWTA